MVFSQPCGKWHEKGSDCSGRRKQGMGCTIHHHSSKESENYQHTESNEFQKNTVQEQIVIEEKQPEIVDKLVDNNITLENKCSIKEQTRINNAFALANKLALNKYKEKWNDFITYESNANKKLLSYILDTNIVVASEEYSIITNSLEGTVNLINENIQSLETDLKKFYGMDCKLIAITNDKWNKIKLEYINNIKNGIKYSIINEEISTIADNDKKNDNNKQLEELANEIFGSNVEIK